MENNFDEIIKISNENLINYKLALDEESSVALKFARENHIPVLLEDTAKLLFSCVQNSKPNSILEIGTAIGYSGILMLKANKNSNLTTIENFESNFEIAKKHFISEKLDSRCEMIFDDAWNAICNLQQQNRKFDFIFLDGPKGQYIKYLPILKSMLNNNGILFSDNVHFKGMVFLEGTIPHRKRTIVVNLRKFLKTLHEDTDFVCSEQKVGDGVMISQKIK